MRKRITGLLLVALSLFVGAARTEAATYIVGPGQTYLTPSAVPWESLQPGDLVLINWRSTPYTDKWVICRQGTEAQPIVVRGVPGAGRRAARSSRGKARRRGWQLDYWGEQRAVIKIGGASIPADTMPRYITIENLDVRAARPPYTFIDDGGGTQSYVNNAAAIWIEKGEHIVVRGNDLHDTGNGIFVSSAEPNISRDILIEGNAIYDNGNVGSLFEHNTYTEALGIVYQFNYFGPTKSGAGGNNLKDRSAGLVVRYNWIEGGNRQLDLVETDSLTIQNDPSYRETLVYGNVLVETDASGNRQIVHYGGDNGTTSKYRKGTLHFYQNTMVSYRTDRTTLFRLSTNDERADVRNNIFYVTAAGNTLSLVDATGILDLTHNWFKPGRVATFGTLSGTINDDGTSVESSSPGFRDEPAQDFRLAMTSINVNKGAHVVARGAAGSRGGVAVRQASGLRGAIERRRLRSRGVRDGGRPAGRSRHHDQQPALRHRGYAVQRDARGERRLTPYLWAVDGLPAGLSVNSSTGVISGTPSRQQWNRHGARDGRAVAGRYRDARPVADDRGGARRRIRSRSRRRACRTRKRNKNYNRTLTATGGVTPYAWSLASGRCRRGCRSTRRPGRSAGRRRRSAPTRSRCRCAIASRRRRTATSVDHGDQMRSGDLVDHVT